MFGQKWPTFGASACQHRQHPENHRPTLAKMWHTSDNSDQIRDNLGHLARNGKMGQPWPELANLGPNVRLRSNLTAALGRLWEIPNACPECMPGVLDKFGSNRQALETHMLKFGTNSARIARIGPMPVEIRSTLANSGSKHWAKFGPSLGFQINS